MLSRGFTHESTADAPFEWYTPPIIFERMGVEFDLDPCSPGAGKSFVPARKHLTIVDDGLATPWDKKDFAFVNPPYGRETQKWMRKLAEHGNGIALVFARTDVAWFQEVADRTSAICFVSGRIRFYKGNLVDQGDTPGAGSMLVGFGERAKDVLIHSELGAVFLPQARRSLSTLP